jgi:hypothetical protein
MRIWGGTFLGVVACLLAGTSVAVAAPLPAGPGFDVHERRLTTRLLVSASNGYEGLISTQGHKQVTLVLFKGRTVFAARTGGQATRHGIEADFGEMGSVSVRFDPGPKGKGSDAGGFTGIVANTLDRRSGNASRCRGRKPVFEEGVFRGRIHFEGENGFTRIDSSRAAGFVNRHYPRVCRRGSEKDSITAALEGFLGKLRYTTLQAQGRADGARLLFEAKAVQLSGRGTAFGYEFTALSVEHREGMRLMRGVSAGGNEGSFLFSKKGATPQTATITPQKPFTGTAEYVKEKGAPAIWTGTLAARLPGAGLVPLAGIQFRADLCRLTFAAVLDDEKCLQGAESPGGLLADLGVEWTWAAPQPRG